MPGTLFVVATPIGNLEDLSFRALRTLKEVDVIAAEDTRRTARLLAHYAIRKPMVSLREHNERRETPKLIARLASGQSIACVSDAGTPGIADPGQHLVRAARDAGIKVTPIPGPSAIMAALSATGIPADHFMFMGFVPRSGSERTRWLETVRQASVPVVFFEAPHRIRRTLADLRHKLVKQQIYVHRELSKIHEEYSEQPNNDITEIGEFVVVIGPPPNPDLSETLTGSSVRLASRMIDYLTKIELIGAESAVAMTAKALSTDQTALKNLVKKARIKERREAERLP